MVNVIVQFKENKKNPEIPIAFYNKKVCFATKDSDPKPKPGEYWECWKWVEKDKYVLLKTFRKIDEANLHAEEKRVEQFNIELTRLESLMKEGDFEKIIYDEKNKPYLLSTKPLNMLKEKYRDYIIIKKDNGKWIRPIMTAEDRKEYQRQVI